MLEVAEFNIENNGDIISGVIPLPLKSMKKQFAANNNESMKASLKISTRIL